MHRKAELQVVATMLKIGLWAVVFITVLYVFFFFACLDGSGDIDVGWARLHPVTFTAEPAGLLGLGPYWSAPTGDVAAEFQFSVSLLLMLAVLLSTRLVLLTAISLGKFRVFWLVFFIEVFTTVAVVGAPGLYFAKLLSHSHWPSLAPYASLAFACQLVVFLCALFLSKESGSGLHPPRKPSLGLPVTWLVGTLLVSFAFSEAIYRILLVVKPPLTAFPLKQQIADRVILLTDRSLDALRLVSSWWACALLALLSDAALGLLSKGMKPTSGWLSLGQLAIVVSASFYQSGDWTWVVLAHWDRFLRLLSLYGREEFVIVSIVVIGIFGSIPAVRARLRGSPQPGEAKHVGAATSRFPCKVRSALSPTRKTTLSAILVGVLFATQFGRVGEQLATLRAWELEGSALAVVALPAGSLLAAALRLGPECRYCGVSKGGSEEGDVALLFQCGRRIAEAVWLGLKSSDEIRVRFLDGLALEGVGGCTAVSVAAAREWSQGIRTVWKNATCCEVRHPEFPAGVNVPLRAVVSRASELLALQFVAPTTCRGSLRTVVLTREGDWRDVRELSERHVLWVGSQDAKDLLLTINRVPVYGDSGFFPDWETCDRVRLWACDSRGVRAQASLFGDADLLTWNLHLRPHVLDVADGGKLLLLADRGSPFTVQRFFVFNAPIGKAEMIPLRGADALTLDLPTARAFVSAFHKWVAGGSSKAP